MTRLVLAAALAVPALFIAAPKAHAQMPILGGVCQGCGGGPLRGCPCARLFPRIHQHGPLYNHGPYVPTAHPYGPGGGPFANVHLCSRIKDALGGLFSSDDDDDGGLLSTLLHGKDCPSHRCGGRCGCGHALNHTVAPPLAGGCSTCSARKPGLVPATPVSRTAGFATVSGK